MSVAGEARMAVGHSHERMVADRLRAHGWFVTPFGQDLLSVPARHVLGREGDHALWRWIPDLLCEKNGRKACLVEAKDVISDSPNFSLEVTSHDAQLRMLALGLPIVYVWSDFTCNTIDRLKLWGPYDGVAADRTSFYLVRKVDQMPFEWAFGPPSASVQSA